MASKVLVKLPTVPFSQGKKPSPELVTLPNRNEGTAQTRHQRLNGDRTAQLEQNMKFLQEQHQATLASLHEEVETLRQRNRELQFQLVFSKGSNTPNSSSSPEDSENGFTKPKGSPTCVNVTPLQVELLEKDLQDIKTSLNEAKTHNIYLSDIIERQKKMLDLTLIRDEKLAVTDVGVQVGGGSADVAQVDLATRLEDAEAMVKRLRRENEDQRKEIATIKAALYNGNGSSSGRHRGSSNAHHNRNSQGEGDEHTSHKFPPLQTQNYWYRGSRGNHGFGHNSDYHQNGRSRGERQDRETEADNTVLPQLRNGVVKSENSSSYSSSYRPRSYMMYDVGNCHSGGGGRKYRGQRSQRYRRDNESRDHHREYKDREYCEAAGEGSRDSKNSKRQ